MAVYELRHNFSLKLLFCVANLKKSTYHYHVRNLTKPDKYAVEKEAIQRIFHQHNGLYGYRRICLALRKEGIHLNHKTVRRLMDELHLKGIQKTRKYRSYRGKVGHIANNEIDRHFEAAEPNKVWLTDVTEIKVNGEKLYLSAFLDVFNREIVGYELTKNPNFELIKTSFEKAVTGARVRSESETIIHSDQGWLYQIPRFRELLAPYKMRQSMSRKGNCYDNALMEGFFGILKNECIYLQRLKTVEETKRAIDDYIRFYNQDRIKVKLNGMSPVEYRLAYKKTA